LTFFKNVIKLKNKIYVFLVLVCLIKKNKFIIYLLSKWANPCLKEKLEMFF